MNVAKVEPVVAVPVEKEEVKTSPSRTPLHAPSPVPKVAEPAKLE